ncbi:biliverdin-producing heme oxygenase [Falsirhodobacter halotolerans]|uniref:biliverdin-producing heme oxygenase n=1 Tax=Falsirhodobacter halotolerans TaxID=1146892 RepID=UPI002456303C|nr:biliverdin-producing heme oxygenase [Falsirhodobacter halotolerans]
MKNPARPSDRRWSLRQATAPFHDALDTAMGTFDTRADYLAYLAGLHAFRAAIEPALRPLDGWHPTRLLLELTADMTDCGLAPRPIPAPPSLAGDAAWGVTYVLEGSALGAQLLRRRAAALGFDDTFGARHLAQPLDSWRAFLDRLDQASPYDADAATAGAVAAFATAHTAFLKDMT